jgi:hypothetical protein
MAQVVPTPASSVPTIVEEPGAGRVEIFALPTEEATLHRLLREVFEQWWDRIVFGTLVQGAVYEIQVDGPPERVSLLDGYLTVTFPLWHFHICIGENKGLPHMPTAPDLAAHRRTNRVELARMIRPDGTPRSWQLRLFNGKGENQLTVFLPHPFLDPGERITETPDWSRLEMWNALRRTYLGLEPDPFDRTAHGNPCGGG